MEMSVIFVVLLVEQGTKLDRVWELKVPPESQLDQVAPASLERANSEHSCEGHPWDEEGDWGMKFRCPSCA